MPAATIQLLEMRRLLSGTVSFANGVLTVSGSSINNVSSLSASGGGIVVKLDGVSSAPFTSVKSIIIKGNDGNDTVTVGGGIIGCSISGGNGNDTLRGGAGNDTLDGGAGNDLLDGGAG